MFRIKETLFLLALSLAATPLAAQSPEYRQIDVKNLSTDQFNSLLRMLPLLDVSVNGDASLRTLFVRGTPEAIARVEAAVKRLDVPVQVGLPRNIEVASTLLLARNTGEQTETLPPGLEPVARQLRALFHFKSLQLLDTAFARVREGTQSAVEGATAWPLPPENSAATYFIEFSAGLGPKGDKGYQVRLDKVRLRMRTPYPGGSREVGLHSTIDLREGQQAVIGRSNIAGTDLALILVMTAKVVE